MKQVFVFFCITVLVFCFFFAQTNWPEISVVYFLLGFLVFIVPVADLISSVAAIYTSLLNAGLIFSWITFGEGKNDFYYLAVGEIALTVYYLFIKTLTSDKHKLIQKSEKYFRSLINASPNPIVVKNMEGEVVMASKSINKFLGLREKQLVGRNLGELIHPDYIPKFIGFLKQITDSSNLKYSTEVRLRKGSRREWIWVKVDGINLQNNRYIRSIVLNLHDITEEKDIDFQKSEMLKQEAGARSVAEKAVRDRDEFLSIASHELKTPLTSVILLLQSTLRKVLTQSLADFSGNELLSSLQIVERQSQSLSILIKDLLNVSLASTGRLTLNKGVVDLTELTRGLVQKYSEEIRLSHCEVEIINNSGKEIIGNWDAIRLEQAMTNLLMNAIKYASGTKITIVVKKEKGLAYFVISDKGVGIDEQIQSEIFEPFKRGNNGLNARGLGVGLFIAKQIAVAHGGEIDVNSKPGKGATFTLSIPI